MEENTQTTDEREAATQTVESQEMGKDELEVELEMATLVNKFLHASYWFLVLGVTFSHQGLEGLARAVRRRQDSSLEAATSLLATMERPRLADVLKPDWEMKGSCEVAVRRLAQVAPLPSSHTTKLDEWLEEGVVEVQGKVGRSRELSSLLARLVTSQRDFHWDSRIMVDRIARE